VGALDRNPLDRVAVPKKNPPRLRYEPFERCVAIVEAQEEPYRTLSALLHATGAEISAALRMVRRDIDLNRMTAHLPGSKTHSRNRHEAVIENWARPYLERHLALLDITAPPSLAEVDAAAEQLFPGLTRFKAHWYHRAACQKVKVADYRMHDARHSLAVRCRRRGVSLEGIAAQLGHKTIHQVVECYARFTPTLAERHEEAPR
jgi:integrase